PVDGLRGLGRSLTSAIGAANNVIEGSQRYAEFSRQVRKGANTTDAFRAGMDVTTDFRRSGNAYSVKAAGNVFAFMNAGLQGTYSMYRMVQEGKFDQKQLAGRIAKSLAMYAVLPVLIRTLIRGDDEDEQAYQLMAENVKRNNYLIPKSWVGGKKGEFFKWALPNGPLPATGDAFGRALVESIEHEGRLDAWVQYGLGDYAKETLGELVESINPFSSPIYAPISQLMQNRTWYDAPIVPEWMRSEHISKSQQVTDATSSVGIFFANLPGLKDNVSPIQVDYLINQSFGVLGDLALSDAGDALTAKLQGDGAWLGVFKAAGKTVGDMFASRINTNPTIASDMTSAMYAAMDTLGGIAADMDKDGFSNALNEHLTLAERTEAARLADKACKRGGVLYAAKKNNAAAYKTLDALMAGSGDAEEKALRARSIKFKMLMENAAAVRYYEEYMKQYVKGTPAQYRARARAKAS
ncbi:MAG: LPD38 domain-containing protein, partial [Clostridia bacterium]